MKFGIVTHYYKSNNYGGNLQAYALCKVIEKNGYKAEQLCLPSGYYQKKAFPKRQIIDFKNFIKSSIYKFKYKNYYKNLKIRTNAMEKFNQEQIPHSDICYDLRNIKKSLSNYQAFITGSDIVWGPKVHSPFFFLNFVPCEIPKFSYAASLGTNQLTDSEKEIFKNDLASYQAISVREKSVAPILSQVTGKEVEICLDPTLLLDKEDWNEICSCRMLEDEYVFCYFLGNNSSAIKVAKEYAKKNKLKLVNIPYLSNEYNSLKDFGDVKLSNVSPSDFLSLIKHANCIFTDSFHACVFSYIYKKNVIAFRRSKNDDLSVRVKDFLSLIKAENHYCDTDEKESLQYIDEQITLDCCYELENINSLKKKSLSYLQKNLTKTEEVVKQNEK